MGVILFASFKNAEHVVTASVLYFLLNDTYSSTV